MKDSNANYNESREINKNRYATKKTIAQGLLDLALLISNIAQLKTILDEGESYPNFAVMITLIAVSITFQVLVGIVMIILGRMDLNNEKTEKSVEIWNDIVTIGIFLITIINVVINAFSLNHDAAHHSSVTS